jgi:hypothetical protein
MSTIVTLAALLIALLAFSPNASKGINPVQHSERGINPVQHSERTTSEASKGINPVQHSE